MGTELILVENSTGELKERVGNRGWFRGPILACVLCPGRRGIRDLSWFGW